MKLTKNQLIDRADNKLEALIFFATKKLQEYKLAQDGIIDYGVPQETICNMIDSQEKELQVLHYINHRITFND
jgi:alpha-D-ribose 1-methylphosphonate 5-phosphate C-P lyase